MKRQIIVTWSTVSGIIWSLVKLVGRVREKTGHRIR